MAEKILQTGLYCSTDEDAKEMIERVNKYNTRHLTSPIGLDVIPFEKGDDINGPEFPHYKLRFLFPDKQAQRDFWTTG